jgi:hypothetical protein
VQVEALSIRLRPRGHWEAADLGVRLCQRAARSVFGCYWLAAVPVIAVALAAFEIAAWLPAVVLWFAKPWLDRSILFALARAAFGTASTPIDLWRAQRDIWWRQLIGTWTLRRLCPWRSLTQPVHQLEGLSMTGRIKRAALIRRGRAGAGTLLTAVFGWIELVLVIALIALAFWFAPSGHEPDLTTLFDDGERQVQFALAVAYGVVVAFLEPFYVAAGFAMYLNRRAELEAWDIEQELRRAFG